MLFDNPRAFVEAVVEHVQPHGVIVRPRVLDQDHIVLFKTRNSLYEFVLPKGTELNDDCTGTLTCRRGTFAGHDFGQVRCADFYTHFPAVGAHFHLPVGDGLRTTTVLQVLVV